MLKYFVWPDQDRLIMSDYLNKAKEIFILFFFTDLKVKYFLNENLDLYEILNFSS